MADKMYFGKEVSIIGVLPRVKERHLIVKLFVPKGPITSFLRLPPIGNESSGDNL